MTKAFAVGWVLVASAIILLILEAGVRYDDKSINGLMSSYALFSILAPDMVVKFRNLIPPDIWFPFLKTIFDVPAWALFGLPGLIVIWRFWPHFDSELAAIEQDMYLYDRLLNQANDFDEEAHASEIKALMESLTDGQTSAPDPAQTVVVKEEK